MQAECIVVVEVGFSGTLHENFRHVLAAHQQRPVELGQRLLPDFIPHRSVQSEVDENCPSALLTEANILRLDVEVDDVDAVQTAQGSS